MSHLREIPQAAMPVLNYLKAAITNGQTLTGTNAWVKIVFDAPSFNDCFTESSDVFTCTKAGFYVVHATFCKTTNTSSNSMILTVNGTYQQSATYRADYSTVFTGNLELAIGDTIQFDGYNTTGGTGGWLGKILAVRVQ